MFDLIGHFLTFEEFCNLKPRDEVYFDWTKRVLSTYPKLFKVDEIIIVEHLWAIKTSDGFIHIRTQIPECDYPLYDIWVGDLTVDYDPFDVTKL